MLTIKKVIIRDSSLIVKKEKLEKLRSKIASIFKTTTDLILFETEEHE